MTVYSVDEENVLSLGLICRGIRIRDRALQNAKEAEQANSDFLDFIIGQFLAEFLLINGFELLNRLAA